MSQQRTYDDWTIDADHQLMQAVRRRRTSFELWGAFRGTMIVCPRCASKRVVLLTFPEDDANLLVVMPPRIARCADCGHRLTPAEVKAQEKPSLN